MKNRIRIERAIINITQAELAKCVEVSRQTVNAVELEKYIPSTVLALKIAEVFKKNVNEIFELEITDWKDKCCRDSEEGSEASLGF